jgi:hypothetical protein
MPPVSATRETPLSSLPWTHSMLDTVFRYAPDLQKIKMEAKIDN